ncbi:MAG: DUF427 domain-containing protein [Anaerolineae bacterium]
MPANITPEKPTDGQESVWDYPRPPRVEKTTKTLKVIFNGEVIAETHDGYRVLETSHPPAYYIPQRDVQMQYLEATTRRTMCEFKGVARYWTIKVGAQEADNAAWSYPQPAQGFEPIKDHICFYANRVDACYVDEEQVQAQAGDFYGGWITSDVVGPFKGAPGTLGW